MLWLVLLWMLLGEARPLLLSISFSGLREMRAPTLDRLFVMVLTHSENFHNVNRLMRCGDNGLWNLVHGAIEAQEEPEVLTRLAAFVGADPELQLQLLSRQILNTLPTLTDYPYLQAIQTTRIPPVACTLSGFAAQAQLLMQLDPTGAWLNNFPMLPWDILLEGADLFGDGALFRAAANILLQERLKGVHLMALVNAFGRLIEKGTGCLHAEAEALYGFLRIMASVPILGVKKFEIVTGKIDWYLKCLFHATGSVIVRKLTGWTRQVLLSDNIVHFLTVKDVEWVLTASPFLLCCYAMLLAERGGAGEAKPHLWTAPGVARALCQHLTDRELASLTGYLSDLDTRGYYLRHLLTSNVRARLLTIPPTSGNVRVLWRTKDKFKYFFRWSAMAWSSSSSSDSSRGLWTEKILPDCGSKILVPKSLLSMLPKTFEGRPMKEVLLESARRLAHFLARQGIIEIVTRCVPDDESECGTQISITIFPMERTSDNLRNFDDLTTLISHLIAHYNNEQISYSPQMQEILRPYYNKIRQRREFEFAHPLSLLPGERPQDQRIGSNIDYCHKSCL